MYLCKKRNYEFFHLERGRQTFPEGGGSKKKKKKNNLNVWVILQKNLIS